ncbi:cupin domain-containing protein [Microbaculum marinum]|uniref:Cupin domain-containing protein n=1 Tax=Microbaculum marinum TaxID=1764581 RepID=A0AAW9RDD5_9HYPH
MTAPLTPERIIEILGMKPHPEGGFFVETYRDTPQDGGRAHSTGIYFLLRRGDFSHWHRVDASEMWHWYAGAPLALYISEDASSTTTRRLGNDLLAGDCPQAVVPRHAWQAAESLGDWTLIGCTVAPGFEFEGFELAPEDWKPEDWKPGAG